MPLVSVLAFSLAISASGDTVSKFRSKTISVGFALAFSRTSLPSFTNSSARPFRLAASLSLTEKNKSLTTARTRFGSCFCIDVCFSRKPLSLNVQREGTFEFYHESLLPHGAQLLVERVVSRIPVRPVFQVQADPAACPHQVGHVTKQIRQAARAARTRRVVVQRRLALCLHACEYLRRRQRLHAGRHNARRRWTTTR